MKTLELLIRYFFILLFCYAAVSKIMDFDTFQRQLIDVFQLSSLSLFIAYFVIIAELIIAALLCYQRTCTIGLFLSFTMMLSFSLYILCIMLFREKLPCSCGGILQNMSWSSHLIFNLVCSVLASYAWWQSRTTNNV